MPATTLGYIWTGISSVVASLGLQKLIITMQNNKLEKACASMIVEIDKLKEGKQDLKNCGLKSDHFKEDLKRIESKVDKLDEKIDDLTVAVARKTDGN